MNKCDICGEDVLPGQPRRGPPPGPGLERHWECHTRVHGKPEHVIPLPLVASVARAVAPRRPAVLRPRVRSGELNRSENARREFKLYGFISEMGKRRAQCDCPFCNAHFWVYVWSLSGGGKRCPNCRAMFTSYGFAYPIAGNEDLTDG